MSAHKSIDKICVVIVAFTLLLTVVFCNGQALGLETTAHAIGYENRLFDRSKVHSLEIFMDDWDGFLETCESETYSPCTVIIDGEAVKNVGIRGKGNTSLSSVKNMDSSRYSFKIEFDQYDSTKSYHGLDKLCLNNIIQDNTYMKDYLAYSLMYDFGVSAPLCSYAYITVNGEDWGLYLAVEAIEEAFLARNYGSNFGDLYKPDAMSFGGGRGNGKDFRMSEFMEQNSDSEESESEENTEKTEQKQSRRGGKGGAGGEMPDFGNFDFGNMPNPKDFDFGEMPSDFSDFDPSKMFGGGQGGENGEKGGFGGFGGGFGMGSSDVKLQYTDDEISSYSNIFNNAKTTVTEADKARLIASLKALSEQSDLENTLDTDEVLRYFVVHNFLCNGDSYTGQMIHNYYLYEKDGQLSMIPWDYNLAYGSFMGGNGSSSVNAAIDTPVSGGMSDRPMIAWIFDQEAYTEQYHQLFSEFLDSVDLDAMITETAAMIDEYVEKDPTKFCTYEEFQKGVSAIRSFCTLRAESVSGQLSGTIPATSDGQKADSSALIDTSGLNISDMGSMGSGGGFGGGFGGKSFGKSGDPEKNDAEKPDKMQRKNQQDQSGQTGASALSFRSLNNSDAPAAAERPDFGGNMPDFGDRSPKGFDPNNMPEGFDPNNMPGGFDRDNMPEDFDPNNMPEGFAPDGGNGQNQEAPTEEPESDGQPAKEGAQDEKQPEKPASDDEKSRNAPDKGGASGGRPQMGGGFPEMGGEQSDRTADFLFVGISALVLLFGLGFALKFKR